MQLKLQRDDLYLPTSPHYRVKGVIPESATPMQSAAKVPILVAFQVQLLDFLSPIQMHACPQHPSLPLLQLQPSLLIFSIKLS